MEGYCVSCKEKKPMDKATEKTASNGRRMMSGVCSQCNCKMNVFLPNKNK
jgi:hypothetical protein